MLCCLSLCVGGSLFWGGFSRPLQQQFTLTFVFFLLFLILVPHLSVDDKYQSPRPSEDHLVVEGRVEEVDLTWEVPNLEVDEGAAGDVVLVDLVGALKEQGFIGRHFVEHHLKSDLGSDNNLPQCILCHVGIKTQPVNSSNMKSIQVHYLQ